jgi:hypothetical protein
MSDTTNYADLVARLRQLANAVADGDSSAFTMSIPVRPDRDADVVLLRSANALEAQAAELAKCKTTMIAAAEEIHAHWDAHCDAEGYGPANLQRRLEEGVPAEYGYTAGRFAELIAERDAAKAELARLRAERVPAGYVNGDELADLDREASISLLVEGEATDWCKTPIYTATAQPAPSVEWSSADGDRCLEALFSAAHEHGESGRGFREDARRIIAEMMPAQPSADARDAACTWTWQEGDEVWATSCGNLFALGAGTPKDNGMRWCCYCRAAIDAAAGKEKT